MENLSETTEEPKRGRAWRRWQKIRRKARALKIVLNCWATTNGSRCQEEWIKNFSNRMADTGTGCSCPACGNERRHFGRITVQERRAPDVEDFNEDISDME